jgi:hypothetical protein
MTIRLSSLVALGLWLMLESPASASPVVGVAAGGNTNSQTMWYTAHADGTIYDSLCREIVTAPTQLEGFIGNVALNAICIAWGEGMLHFFNLLTSEPYNGSCSLPSGLPVKTIAITRTFNGLTFSILYANGALQEGWTGDLGHSYPVFSSASLPCEQPTPTVPVTWGEIKVLTDPY